MAIGTHRHTHTNRHTHTQKAKKEGPIRRDERGRLSLEYAVQ